MARYNAENIMCQNSACSMFSKPVKATPRDDEPGIFESIYGDIFGATFGGTK